MIVYIGVVPTCIGYVIYFNVINIIKDFFFQAEDGIRDLYVTGVQTCALPIFVGAGAYQRKAVSRNTAAGEIDVVHHAQSGEQRGYLVGAAQAPANALVRREDRYILPEE